MSQMCAEGSTDAGRELLWDQSHCGAGICFLHTFFDRHPLPKTTVDEGVLGHLALAAGGKEVAQEQGLGISAQWEPTWLKIRFGEGCWGGGQAERSLVSVLSGWLGY